MAIVVQKYGGSSVADVTRMKKVAERVMRTRGQGHDVVVVVSAMGDTTDELLALAKQVSANPDRRELDMLLTAGERISMALLSIAIRELGGEAISFTGSQSGIITNDRHVDARIIEVRPYRVQDELARGRIVVIAGYQGVSYRREITTLGRGGSDTTAVAMAAALGAEYCEICSDVDGVYTRGPARGRRRAADRHAVVRGDAGAGRIGREGPERAGGRVREGKGHRDLRARDRVAAARSRPIGRRHGRPPRRGAAGRARWSASPANAMSWCFMRGRPWTRRGHRRSRTVHADVLALLDEHNVAGKQLHLRRRIADLVISRENLHEEDRLRAELVGNASATGPPARHARRGQRDRRRHQRLIPEPPPRHRRARRRRHRRRSRRDVVVQDHVDDRPRAARRCGQAAARDVHRITVRLKPDATSRS